MNCTCDDNRAAHSPDGCTIPGCPCEAAPWECLPDRLREAADPRDESWIGGYRPGIEGD